MSPAQRVPQADPERHRGHEAHTLENPRLGGVHRVRRSCERALDLALGPAQRRSIPDRSIANTPATRVFRVTAAPVTDAPYRSQTVSSRPCGYGFVKVDDL